MLPIKHVGYHLTAVISVTLDIKFEMFIRESIYDNLFW